MRLAKSSGLDVVGVRALAAELAVTPMALYRHVPDATALRQAVVAQLLEDLPAVMTVGDWQRRTRRWALEARRIFARAPGLALFVLQHWTELPQTLRAVESLGSMFKDAGPPGTDAVAAANTVFTYVLMRVQAEEAVSAGGATRALGELKKRRDELPFLWAHRSEYSAARMDDHFTYGLELILAGLTTSLASLRRTDVGS